MILLEIILVERLINLFYSYTANLHKRIEKISDEMTKIEADLEGKKMKKLAGLREERLRISELHDSIIQKITV